MEEGQINQRQMAGPLSLPVCVPSELHARDYTHHRDRMQHLITWMTVPGGVSFSRDDSLKEFSECHFRGKMALLTHAQGVNPFGRGDTDVTFARLPE